MGDIRHSARQPTVLACSIMLVAPLSLAASPQVDYFVNCAGCHRPDGSGLQQSVPDMRTSLAALIRADGGREFLIQVPGTAQSNLSDAQVAAVLNWLLETVSAAPPPANWPRYTAEEVSRVRRTPLIDVKATRDALLNAAGRR